MCHCGKLLRKRAVYHLACSLWEKTRLSLGGARLTADFRRAQQGAPHTDPPITPVAKQSRSGIEPRAKKMSLGNVFIFRMFCLVSGMDLYKVIFNPGVPEVIPQINKYFPHRISF